MRRVPKTPRVLKSGKQQLAYYQRLWNTILSGKPWHSEIVDKRKDGALYAVDQTITPVKDESGAITNFVAIQQDISERMQAEKKIEDSQKAIVNVLEDLRAEKANTEKEKAKDEAMLGSIGDGLIAVDNVGKIMVMNKTAETLLGWNMSEAIGKHYDDVISLEDEKGTDVPLTERPLAKALSTSSTTTATSITSFYIHSKNKVKFPVAITVSPIVLDNQIIGAIEVFHDITHEKEIDRAKTEFVSLASHQLRTPLSTIGWYTEMLLGGDAGALTDTQKKYLDEVYMGNKRMVELVNSLLNVSRIETGSFGIEPQKVAVKDVVESVLKDLSVDLAKKKLVVEATYDDVTVIDADPKLLRMIFQNVLSNAQRYTPAGGVIYFRASRRPTDILFTIRDTGIGIPHEAQKKMFTKLYRADNAQNVEPNGTGLGLYMVKSILDHAGGRIWFESEEGKGSTFYVTIPLAGMKQREGGKGLV